MRTHKKILVGSGSSTKISFMLGRTLKLMSENSYDAFIATSGTAIIFPLVAAGKEDELLETLFSDKSLNDLYFDNSPLKFKNGKMKVKFWNLVWKFLTRSNALSTTSKFRELYKSIFTLADFNSLKDKGITIYLCCASVNTRRALYVNNLDFTYEEFIAGVIGSSNMPIATNPVKIRDSWVYDGGLVDHFAGRLAALLNPDHIDIILSRPQFSKSYQDTGYKTDLGWENKKVVGLEGAAANTLTIFNYSISSDDELVTELMVRAFKIKQLTIYYAPYRLSNQIYNELDSRQMLEWYNLGLNDNTSRRIQSN